VSGIARYLRIYVAFVRFSCSRAMAFRLDFFFRVGMDALWYATHLAFFAVIYGHTAELGGWTREQAFVFCGALFVADALQMTFFANNLHWLPILINKGDLDYHLVRPVSPLFVLTLREFAANSAINLAMALAILAWALARYEGPLPVVNVIAFAVLLVCGVVLFGLLHLLFVIPTFWLHTPRGLRDVFYGLVNTWCRPHRIYTGWLRRVLTTVLPFAVIVSYPVEALLAGPSLALVCHVAAVLAGAAIAVAVVWRAGLVAYSSASS